MKTIKKVLLIALLLAGSSAFAQQGMENRPERQGSPMNNHGEHLMKQLNLTPEQQAQLEKINKDYHQKDSIAFADFRKQQQAVRLEQMKDFKSILTKDQMDQFQKMLDLRAGEVLFNDGKRLERMGRERMRPERMGRERMGRQEAQEPQGKEMNCDKCPMHMDMQKQHKPGVEKGKQNHEAGKRPIAKLSPEERNQKRIGMLKVALDLKEDQVAKIKTINQKYTLKDPVEKSDKKFNRKQMKARQAEIKSILDKQQLAKYETFLRMAKKGHSQKKLN